MKEMHPGRLWMRRVEGSESKKNNEERGLLRKEWIKRKETSRNRSRHNKYKQI